MVGNAQEVKYRIFTLTLHLTLGEKKNHLYHFKVKVEGQRKGKHLALKMKVIITLAGKHPNHQAR